MKFQVTVDGKEGQIEVLSPAPECRFRTGDGEVRGAQVEIPGGGVFSVLLNGRNYEAYVEERPGGGVVVTIAGYRFEIDVLDPRRWRRKAGGRGAAGIQQITAPMPGKVVRVLIALGDAVTVGQGLIVVEAMKMQNELKATRSGTVITVRAKAGDTVAAGETLATIE